MKTQDLAYTIHRQQYKQADTKDGTEGKEGSKVVMQGRNSRRRHDDEGGTAGGLFSHD